MHHQTRADTGRIISLVGGGVALAWGLRRLSLPGLAAGGALLYYGLSGARGTAGKSVDIRTSVSIDRPAEELYQFWHGFTRLPQFMRYLEEVTPSGPNRTHWVARAPVGPRVQWDSEVTADEPNERIAWRSVEGSMLMNEGEVRFIPAVSAADQGTMVELAMRIHPPGGAAGSAIGQLLSGMTEQTIDADLHRFKRLMESGGTADQGITAH